MRVARLHIDERFLFQSLGQDHENTITRTLIRSFEGFFPSKRGNCHTFLLGSELGKTTKTAGDVHQDVALNTF